MVAIGGQPHEALILLQGTNKPSPIVTRVHNHLAKSGYQLSIIGTLEHIWQQLNSHPFNVVLAVDDSNSLAFFEAIRQKNGTQETRLILITDNPDVYVDKKKMALIDLLLPSNVTYLENLLKQYLTLWTENKRLHEQNQQLATEAMYLQESLEEQSRSRTEIEILKNAIVRNVSHELKTPLLHVKSAVSLLAEDTEDSSLIKYAENATARLESLVKNITMFGSSLDIKLSPVILRDSMQFAHRNVWRIWKHKEDTDRIELQIEESLPPIIADKQGLSTALQLLMDNALKFSKKKVKVIGKKDGDTIIVAVRDYGIGIEPDKLEKIFDFFYQVDHSSTRRYGGTGVGLALVKLILDHHHTKIHVESTLGKGSMFSFKLPIASLQ